MREKIAQNQGIPLGKRSLVSNKYNVGTRFDKLAKEWSVYCSKYYTVHTCELYKGRLKGFFAFLLQKGNILSSDNIEAFVDFRLATGIEKSTANAELIVVKSFCKWLSNYKQAINYSTKIPLMKLEQKEARIVSPEEYEKLLQVAKGQDRDLILFIANTGLRAAEFNSLKWDNISPNRKYLTIFGKGRKYRIVPLNPSCQEILNKYSPHEGQKLPFVKNNRTMLANVCHKLANRANIKHFGVHALRHYFATALYRKEVPIQRISRLLGHSSVMTTEKIYIHFSPMELIGSTDCLGEK